MKLTLADRKEEAGDAIRKGKKTPANAFTGLGKTSCCRTL
jgi:hypothetical protein